MFPACEGEDALINHGIWGKRLADFLRERLRTEGFAAEEPIAEDWGWVVPIVNDQFRLWIGCACNSEYPDGFLCFIEPHTPLVRKFLKQIETRERVTALQQALDKVLSEAAGIREKCWWTYEELQNPGALRRREPQGGASQKSG